ncbi:MAG TPA: S53 family peptidase [Streptosporangiaceae bacterium]|nr:S53 family peptidase [Streptosporangiaceae bacterium]
MGLLNPRRTAVVAVLGVAAATAATGGGAAALAGVQSQAPHFSAIRGSLTATTDKITGRYQTSRMSVEVALSPRNSTELSSQLRAEYTQGSNQYHRWLSKGQFAARYAPTSAERAAVASYLRSAGLTVSTSASPFLVRATGSSRQVQSAFRTTLSTYRGSKDVTYFSNSAAVRLPATIAGHVLGVIGLSNTVRQHPAIERPGPARPAGAAAHSSSGGSSCETGYVTAKELFRFVNSQGADGFPYGYGAGPGCSGLSPSQTNSIYGAPDSGASAQGRGVTAAVFELSAYQQSDIDTWARQFYGRHYTPPLVDVNVDGGPLNPVCPAGDTCPASFNGYSGDIEVDADIQMSLTIAPDLRHLIVYNAPNDYTGQTELDEYSAIASQDTASTISSSWGVCENDVSAAYAQAENVVFEQMAMQGQSLFNSAGDTGAFGCIRSDGTTIVNAGDPADQPWVTSVGGTSLEGDNPGTNPQPGAPAHGTETVWNVDNLCSASGAAPANDNQGGFFWCAETGAGGGAPSEFWGRPFYQRGPGVNSPAETYANGTTQCILARTGTPCRQGPDISADADPYTGYAEYCTGSASTPESYCATFSGGEPVPGWFQIGGTSLSSPLLAAIFADRNGYQGQRTGNVNPLLYSLFNSNPSRYFNDITGIGPLQKAATNNGQFPSTPGYDMATGIGSPKMAALITGS